MPGNRQVFSTAMNAADRYRWDSQWTEAAREYQRALAEFPDDAAARGGLGFCYMQTKQWPQALNEYEQILKRDSSNVIALSKTAELYVILNRREDAYKAYLHLAELYSQAGQGARAEAAWQKAVQLSPGNPEPHERLATYYQGKKDLALMISERLAAAQGYLQRNEAVVARIQLEEVLRVDATNTQAQRLLSQITGVQPQPPGSQGTGAPLSSTASTMTGAGMPPAIGTSSGPLTSTGNPATDMVTMSNTSGGNTGIMGNKGSAGNFNGGGTGGAMDTTPRKRITANQVTGVLRQAQNFQAQGRFNDAIDLCEQILESGFDRPDARYFLGWLYQEQRRWDEAIRQFQLLLNDPDYALSCYYALGQCYRARGDLRAATTHFDEAVDRVNLDALTIEESDQLVQLCQEAAEAHRLLGEQEQALTVYNALLGFLRSRRWNDKVAQVEFMLKQAQNSPVPARPITPPPVNQPPMPQQGNTTRTLPPEQMAPMPPPQPPVMPSPPQADPAMTGRNMGNTSAMVPPPAPVGNPSNGMTPPPPQQAVPMPPSAAPSKSNPLGELPDWLTGILNDADKTQIANKQPASPPPPAQIPPFVQSVIANQPTTEQPVAPPKDAAKVSSDDTTVIKPASSPAPAAQPPAQSTVVPEEMPTAWLTEGAQHAKTTQSLPSDQQTAVEPAPAAAPKAPEPPSQEVAEKQSADASKQPGSVAPVSQPAASSPSSVTSSEATEVAAPPVPKAQETEMPALQPRPSPVAAVEQSPASLSSSPLEERTKPVVTRSSAKKKEDSAEDLLSQIAGESGKDEALKRIAESVLESTESLPENIRMQVVQSMQDIQNYIDHGLLTSATEECLRVIDMAPQYLDIHQVLCEVYVHQGKLEQAITKYAILIDTYVVNGRVDDAIATYRRILQLDPNNLTYRVRLINLLEMQGSKEDLLRERTQAAESYLRLGYMDRALTELEQALQESPTSVPTRLNYALALQKLGRSQQAVAEYQRVLQVDPRNITALVRWHIAMITGVGSSRATSLELLSRIRWQLRSQDQRYYEMLTREYNQAAETYPNNASIQFALGQVHQQTGNFDSAINAYSLAIRDTSFEVMARVSVAHCLLAQGKIEAVISELEQALQSVRRSPAGAIDPTIWAARPREEGEEHQAPEVEISQLLAKAYGRAGKQDQMRAILRQVRQKTPYRDEVASTLAEISARQGDLDGALQEYADLVRHYRSTRQTDNALTVLNEMVRMAPQDPRAHAELGDIYVNRGLLEEGIAELRLLADIYLRLDQNAKASEALRRIGDIYAEMGDTEEAFTNLRRAAELTPGDMDLLREVVAYCWQIGRINEAVEYQSVIAHHYFDTQQVKESVAALQQLIAIDRKNYDAYDMLGQTYQSVGEYEQASRVYKNLAKVNPESALARERLLALQELRARSA